MEACDAPMKMAQIRVLGGAFSRVPADATAFAHRDATDDGGVPRHVWRRCRSGGQVRALGRRGARRDAPGKGGAYVNFLADEGNAGLARRLPAATLERLRQVKRRYDPENLFRLNQNIPPAA